MPIIYDDAEIRVVWQPGSSDFVLITFGDLINLAQDEQFFAQVPAQKTGMAAIGIMAKRGHWYPRANMQAASLVIAEFTRRYSRRVIYGGSMGGYAAVKFSKLLGATCVLALCPQWSIDLQECDGEDPGWQRYFQPSMRGMGVRREDVVGEIFLFFDPHNKQDYFHSHKIAAVTPSAQLVHVPWVGHHVTLVFAGTQNLLQLIDACLASDLQKARRLSYQIRRGHRVRKAELLRQAVQKHPRIGFELLEWHARQDDGVLRFGSDLLPLLLAYFLSQGWRQRVIDGYEAFALLIGDPLKQLVLGAHLAQATGSQLGIKTAHGTLLYFDVLKGRCQHGHTVDSPWGAYLRVECQARRVALFVEAGGARLHLLPSRQHRLVIEVNETPPSGASAGFFVYELRPQAGGWFALCHGEDPGYLSAGAASSELMTNGSQVRNWERMRWCLL